MAAIVVAVALVSFVVGMIFMAIRKEASFRTRERGLRQDSVQRSRSTLSGQVLERLAPHFPDFPHDPTELRFIGTPVDYVVFRGLSNGAVEEVVFLEVKSGRSALSSRERRVREAVLAGRVRWEEYRTPMDSSLPASLMDPAGMDGLQGTEESKDLRRFQGRV